MDCKYLIIDEQTTVLSALKQMDLINKKLLIVFCGDKFKSLLSIGDIQRAIISNIPLDTPVSEVVRKNVTVGYTNQSAEEIKALMLKFRMEFCPIIDFSGSIARVIMWEDLFHNKIQFSRQ